MFNIDKIRSDFPFFTNHPELVYFDNAGTTQKPKCVLDDMVKVYEYDYANPHSEDYPLSFNATKIYNEARKTIADFINADEKEVVFTSGDTAAMNTIALAIGEKLNSGDEVLITVAEHASNVLPWFKLKDTKNINIGYIKLNSEGKVTIENVLNAITDKTKVISLAHVTNVLGHIVDIKEICKIAHKRGILVVVDGAQSVPHIKTDVKDLDCDFLAFSGHKMLGPTGIGIMYGKYQHLLDLNPLFLGGGMNTRFDTCGNYSLHLPPQKFESGTVNLVGAVGLASACKYLNNIGMENIENREIELRQYCLKKMKEIDGIKIYNETAETGIITFNYKNIFAQDLATHLSSYGICVRSGNHCAKILNNYLNTVATVRVSLYFYNTYEEIDKFIDALKKGDEFLDVYFK